MASIEKRKAGWRVYVCVQGTRESACFRTRKEAAAWGAVREQELREQLGKVAVSRTVREALQKYLDEVTPQKRGKRWESIRLVSFQKEDGFPADVLVHELTPERVAMWRDKRLQEVAAGTVLRELGLLSAVLETARREWRWLASNPVRDVRKPKQPDHREVLYTWRQVRAIVQAMGHRPGVRPVTVAQAVAVCFLVALRTGMRAGELTGLTWDRVRGDFCVLPVTKTVPRNVPLTSKARRLIGIMVGFHPSLVFGIGSASLDANFRKYRGRAGIEGVTFHDARHYAATALSRRLDVLALCRVFGWSNTSQALTYYNESAASIAKRLG